MAKKIHEVPRRRRLPLWVSISIVFLLVVATSLIVYMSLLHIREDSSGNGFATINSVADEVSEG